MRFEYRPSGDCPTEREFLDRVRRRLKHASIVDASALARTFRVTARSSDPESVGSVEFADENGQRVARIVRGSTCDEVVTGIALVSALIIDARADGADAERELLNEITQRPEPAKPPAQYGFGVGMSAGLESWLGPSGGYFLQGFGELSSVPIAGRVRVGTLRSRSSATVDDRRVEWTGLAARVAVCPIELGIASDLALTTWLSVDIGQVEAETQKASSLAWVRNARILWAAAALQPGLRWAPGRALAVDLKGKLGFPLVRHTFVFDQPRQVVFDVPTIGAGVELAVSAKF